MASAIEATMGLSGKQDAEAPVNLRLYKPKEKKEETLRNAEGRGTETDETDTESPSVHTVVATHSSGP